MKTCSNCGAEMDSEAVFCPECGGVPEEKRVSPRKILTKIASEKIVLCIAIMLTVGFLISVVSAFLVPVTPDIDINGLLDSSSSLLEEYGIDVNQLNLDEIADQAEVISSSSSAISRNITITVNIVPMIIAIAFWCIYISAKRGKVKSAGFTILQVLQVIALVLIIIVTVILIVGAVFGLSQLNTLNIPVVNSIAYAFCAFIIGLLIVSIIVRVLTIRTIKSCKTIIKTKNYNGRISAIAAVALIISAGSSLGSSVFVLASAFILGPSTILLAIGNLCSNIAPILCGIVLFKCRFLLEDY